MYTRLGLSLSRGQSRRALGGQHENGEQIPMTDASPTTLESYPREIELDDKRTVVARLMGKSDRDTIVAFARALPPDDLLFLRRDITDPAVVDGWVREIEAGKTVSVLAELGGELLGYGSLCLEETFWGRHMGGVRGP